MMADGQSHKHRYGSPRSSTAATSSTTSPDMLPPPPPSCSVPTTSRPSVMSRAPGVSTSPLSRGGRSTTTSTINSSSGVGGGSAGPPVEQPSPVLFPEGGRPPAPSPPDSVGEHTFYDITRLDREEGYDYDFVPPTDNKYECPICLLVLRGTVQTPCGHRFCTACIHRWLRDTGGPKCPVCNEPITELQLFPDKFADREIMSFNVRCPNYKFGCEGFAELKHLDTHLTVACDYVLAPCPNHCSSVLFKKDVEWHRNKECVKREIICDLCGIKVPTAEKHKHKLECLEESVECQYCKTPILRKQVPAHTDKCDMAPMRCVFNPLGCGSELTRSEMIKHNESNTQYHLNLTARALNSILQLQHAYMHNRNSPLNSHTVSAADKVGSSGLDQTDGISSQQQLQLKHQELGLTLPAASSAVTDSSARQLDPTWQRQRVASEGSCNISEHIGGESDSVRLSNLSTTPLVASTTAYNFMSGTSQPPTFGGGACNTEPQHLFGPAGDRLPQNYVNLPAHDILRQKSDNAAAAANKPSLRQISCEESLRLAGEGGVDFIEKSRQQEASIAGQKQLIFELQAKVASLESRLGEQAHNSKGLKDKMAKQEETINSFEGRNCKGVYIWKIREFSRLRQEAIRGQTTVLHSPGFYTSFYGYKLCVRANLNGVEGGNGSHISIFIHFMRGEYDDILEWPFRGKIILTVIDQGEHRQHVTEVLEAKPSLAAFQKPLSNRNHKGFGYIEFAPVPMIERSTYVLNDTLIIKADVSENQC